MAKPTESYNWTTDPSQRDDMGQGKRDTGFAVGEKPPSRWHNWLWWISGKWNTWLSGINVDQATEESSWDINKGQNVTNEGTRTHTNGCADMNINSNCSDGTTKDVSNMIVNDATFFEIIKAAYMSFEGTLTKLLIRNSESMTIGEDATTTEHLQVINSESGIAYGTHNKVEDCTGFTMAGSHNSMRGCTSVNFEESVSYSSMENIDSFTEDRSRTKTLHNLRLLGDKIVRRVGDKTLCEKVGSANQLMFGNRYLSSKSDIYWYCEDAGNWRLSNNGDRQILGGQQVADGLYEYGVETVDVTDTIQFRTQLDIESALTNPYTMSFWHKNSVTDLTRSDIMHCRFETGGDHSWKINCVNGAFIWTAGSFQALELPDIKPDVYQHFVIVWDGVGFSMYIDGKYQGQLSGGSTAGTGFLSMYFGAEDDQNVGRSYIADFAFWYNKRTISYDVERLLCGGIELSVASPDLFMDSKITAIHTFTLGANREVDEVKFIGNGSDEFVYVRFPDYAKHPSYIEEVTSTSLEVISEKYSTEVF